MKTQQQLSAIAKKAVAKRLDNRLNSLSVSDRFELKTLIDQYYEAKHELDYVLDIPTIIFHEIRKTTLQSFTQNGDRNYLTAEIKRNYISESGIPLDIQALYAGETFHMGISEQDFIDFIIDHPAGPASFAKNLEVDNIRYWIKKITGFNATHKLIETIYYKINTVTFDIPENSPF